ncbi:hypothetical protein J3R83DRAFT_4624 [Lanmaoa asiatica]|nr:hypothetical protein J3R83DRAFT_4624 [Lanmaoa asiatica]
MYILVCLADVSLILPDFDPQPLSVNIVGVGANGETTYQMFPGQPTGTWVGQDPAFSGIVTVVEGASDVLIEYADTAFLETLVESCTFANGVADCVDVSPGMTTDDDGSACDAYTRTRWRHCFAGSYRYCKPTSSCTDGTRPRQFSAGEFRNYTIGPLAFGHADQVGKFRHQADSRESSARRNVGYLGRPGLREQKERAPERFASESRRSPVALLFVS